jgi:hypothetical protein
MLVHSFDQTKEHEMNKMKIVATGIVALALTGVGVGSALASTTPVPAPSTSVTSTTPTTAEAPEAPGTAESATPSDGPGGHADPVGDVNHQGGASEQ